MIVTERVRAVRPLQLEGDLRAFGPTHLRHDLVHRQAGHADAVHLDDLVARDHAGPLGGAVVEHADDEHPPVLLVQHGAHADEGPGQGFVALP